jgi:hypothetical protein
MENLPATLPPIDFGTDDEDDKPAAKKRNLMIAARD